MLKGHTPAQDKINKQQFESLCAIQCTKEEIASVFGVSEDTIENWCHNNYESTFSVAYKNNSDKGKMSLRRYQFKQAEKNPTMAIWLGKQYLGQKDNIEVDHRDLTKVEELLSKIDEEANKGN